MYTKQERDWPPWDGEEMVSILDPEGNTLVVVPAYSADVLLSHLNRE